ncbi:MAG: glycosyltransferase family 39 protein [Dehalococcoidia bacterium]|nr:glycosyltransferase family 39 protein [Dehalococcoidia bacterium]
MRTDQRSFLAGNHRELAVFLAVFLVLSAVYAWTIPYFLSIDEVSHFDFVRRLVLDYRLPVITHAEYYASEEHQPPAYYFLASLVGRALIASPLREVASEMTLVFYGARGLSVLFGMVTTAGAYLLASHFFGSRRLARLGATAIVVFNPSLIAMSGAVTNDSMASAAGVFLLLATVKAASSRLSLETLLAIGVLAGVAALTKENLLPLLLPLAISLMVMVARSGGRQDLVKLVLAVGLPAIAVAAWWYVRNWDLYGDPLAWNMNAVLSPGNVHVSPPDLSSYLSVLSTLAQTFWVGFGPTLDVRAPWPIYFVIWTGCAIALLGALRLFRSRRPIPWLRSGPAAGLALITADLVLLALADLSYNRAFVGAGAGRYFFPVAGAVAIILTFGLISAVGERKPWLLGAFCALLLALSVSSPFVFLASLRVSPNVLTEDTLRRESQPADATFDASMQLVGYRIETPQIRPGENARISLYWKAVAGTDVHWTGYVHVIDSQKDIHGQYDSIPLEGRYPTLFWKKGEIWREDYEVPVDYNAPNGSYQLEVGFYSLQTGQEATVSAQGKEWVGGVPLGQLRVVAPEIVPTPKNPLAAEFRNAIRLTGWDQGADGVVLYWQTATPIPQNLTVFAHYLDRASQVIAQDDGQPAEGRMPTSVWLPGETITDRRRIIAPSGTYTLEVGLYDPKTLERVSLLAGGDTVLLGPVRVPESANSPTVSSRAKISRIRHERYHPSG